VIVVVVVAASRWAVVITAATAANARVPVSSATCSGINPHGIIIVGAGVNERRRLLLRLSDVEDAVVNRVPRGGIVAVAVSDAVAASLKYVSGSGSYCHSYEDNDDGKDGEHERRLERRQPVAPPVVAAAVLPFRCVGL